MLLEVPANIREGFQDPSHNYEEELRTLNSESTKPDGAIGVADTGYCRTGARD
jgi:hypothetical protein